MNTSEKTDQLFAAYVAFKNEPLKITKDKTNPHFESKYASFSAIVEAVGPVLAKHGLAILQPLGALDEKVGMYHVLVHKSGEWMRSFSEFQGTLSDMQKMGSATTYMQRYGYGALLSLDIDEDDDGNAASSSPVRQPVAQSTLPSYKAGEVHVAVDEVQEMVSKNTGKPYTLIKTDKGNFAVFDKGIMDGITIVPGDLLNLVINQMGYVTSIG
jgi:hypothetical protein